MTFQINGTSGVPAASVTQAQLAANVAGNGPCFSAYQSVAQLLTTSGAVIQFQSEEYDLTNSFDTSTYKFQPTIAGYYQVTTGLASSGASNSLAVGIYKNGVLYRTSVYMSFTGNGPLTVANALVYLNGTSDYITVLGNHTAGTNANSMVGIQNTFFQGFLARAA